MWEDSCETTGKVSWWIKRTKNRKFEIIIDETVNVTKLKSSQEKSIELVKKIKEYSIKLEKKALEAENSILWLKAIDIQKDSKNSNNFVWIYDMEEFSEYSFEQYLEKFDEEYEKQLNKRAGIIGRMLKDLESTNEKVEWKVKITLKRNRDKDKNWKYIILWKLENQETQMEDFNIINSELVNNYPLYVCYEPEVPCVNHASDILYKDLRNHSNWIWNLDYIKFKDFLLKKWDNWWIDEFMDTKTKKTQDNEDYVVSALLWYYTNEKKRFIIPKKLYKSFSKIGEK